MAVSSNYPNLYSFFTGWDDGRKAQEEDAANARKAKTFELTVPGLELYAQKSQSELENFLANSELRKRRAEYDRQLADAQLNAQNAFLPDMQQLMVPVEQQRVRGLGQAITQQDLSQEAVARSQALNAQYGAALDPTYRQSLSTLFASGLNPPLSGVVGPEVSAAIAKNPLGYGANIVGNPQAEQTRQMLAQENFLTQQAKTTANSAAAVELARVKIGESAKAKASAANGTPGTAAGSIPALGNLMGTAQPAQTNQSTAQSKAPGTTSAIRTPEEVAQLQRAISMAITWKNNGSLNADAEERLRVWQAVLAAHVAAGGKL